MLGAHGQSFEDRMKERDERQAARREKYNEARRAKRAAQPKKQKLKDARPWETEGISYRTWRRRRAEERGQKRGADNMYTSTIIRATKLAPPKHITLPAETTARMIEIGRIAASISQQVIVIVKQVQRSIPVKDKTGRRAA